MIRYSGLPCIVVALFLATIAFAKNDAVVRSSDFAAMQGELTDLRKTHAKQKDLDDLWEQSQKIAQMNDHCGNISLTDVLDPECSKFYREELPQFEEDFMRITGEIRLSAMSTSISGIQQRAASLKACSDALSHFFFSSEQLIGLKMNRELGLEPLNNDCTEIEVSYDFTLAYDKRRLRMVKNLAEIWVSKCGEIVLNPDRDGLASLFKRNMTEMSDSISQVSDMDVKMKMDGYKVVFGSAGSKYGRYVLGGETLFSSEDDFGQYLIIDLNPTHGGIVDNSPKSQNYKGTKEVRISYLGYDFDALEGRMVWDKRYNNGYAYKQSYNTPESSSSYVSMFAHVRSSSSTTSYNYATYSDYSYEETSESDDEGDGEDDSESSEDNGYYAWSSSSESIDAGLDNSSETDFIVRFCMYMGFNLSTAGTVSEESLMEYPELASDSVIFTHGYIVGLLHLDIGWLSLGVGGGVAWGNASVTEPAKYGSEGKDVNVRSSTVPVIRLDMAYVTEFATNKDLNGTLDTIGLAMGVRMSYMVDDKWPTLYIAPFFEMGFFGIEIGLQHVDKFWDNFYAGLYLVIPTRRMWYSMREWF